MSFRKLILPTLRYVAALSLALGLVLAVAACSTQAKTAAADDHFVHALTAGVISIADPIRIEFVDRIQGMVDDKVFFAKALRFEPAIAGSLAWQSDNVLVFKPAAALPRLANYRAYFDASALRGLVASARDFDFKFSVSGQSLDLNSRQGSELGGAQSGELVDIELAHTCCAQASELGNRECRKLRGGQGVGHRRRDGCELGCGQTVQLGRG